MASIMRFTKPLLSFVPLLTLNLTALSPALAVDRPPANEGEKTAAPQPSLNAANLAQLAADYRSNPDDLTWARYATYARDILAMPQFVSADPAAVIAANPSLSEFKVKVSEVGVNNFRVWSFPRIAESHSVVFQTPARTTSIPLPQNVSFREARIIGVHHASPAAPPVAKKGMSKAALQAQAHAHALAEAARARASAQAAGAAKTLVLIGADRASGALWFKGFHLVEGMPEASELFASLPAFFTQNVTGKASFSGNDIVLTIQAPTPQKADKGEEEKPPGTVKDTITKVKTATPASAGYKVVLKYIGGKFTLAGHMPDDAPQSIAFSFAQAVAAGKPDLAKSWLVDPKLVSIPKYIGLFGRVSPPMRIVPMSAAVNGAARYRLVTSAKDDLIIEVARITSAGRFKGQLAIRALFVAPPDAIAQRLSGSMVLPGGTSPAVTTTNTTNSATSTTTSTAGEKSDKPHSAAPRKN
jgi:hypothetical protein